MGERKKGRRLEEKEMREGEEQLVYVWKSGRKEDNSKRRRKVKGKINDCMHVRVEEK
jgi:hypothetical protein